MSIDEVTRDRLACSRPTRAALLVAAKTRLRVNRCGSAHHPGKHQAVISLPAGLPVLVFELRLCRSLESCFCQRALNTLLELPQA